VAVQPGGEDVGGRRLEAHELAARDDGGQEVGRAVGEQDEVREPRRLLQRLEHPVGGGVVHRLGALDDEDPPGRLERRAVGRGDHGLLHVRHHHVGRARRPHPRQVGVHALLGAARGARGIRRAVGEQRPAKARAAARLPAPAGPWKR
jgi:hypothetical protein